MASQHTPRSPFSGIQVKNWKLNVSEEREAQQLRPWLAGLGELSKDGSPGPHSEEPWTDDIVTFFMQDYCKQKPLAKEFVQLYKGVSLEDLDNNPDGQRASAWIDDTLSQPQLRHGSSRPFRRHRGPLTASMLRRYLEEARFEHPTGENPDRRLVAIRDLDRLYVSVLAEAAPQGHVSALREAFWKHYTLQTCLQVQCSPQSGFRFDFHIPYYVPRMYASDENIPSPITEQKYRVQTDLTSLFGSCSVGRRRIIHRAHITVVMCGTSEKRWTVYSLMDNYFNSEDEKAMENKDFEYKDSMTDQVIGDGARDHDARRPVLDPRELFLLILIGRMAQIQQQWEVMVRQLAEGVCTYIDTHPPPSPQEQYQDGSDHVNVHLTWAQKAVKTIAEILDALKRTTETWDKFRSDDGDINYFTNAGKDSVQGTENIGVSFLKICSIFEELQKHQKTLESLVLKCDRYTAAVSSNLRLQHIMDSNKVARRNGAAAELNVTVVAPVQIACTLLAIPTPERFAFAKQNFVCLVVTIVLAVGLLQILHYLLNLIHDDTRRQHHLGRLKETMKRVRIKTLSVLPMLGLKVPVASPLRDPLKSPESSAWLEEGCNPVELEKPSPHASVPDCSCNVESPNNLDPSLFGVGQNRSDRNPITKHRPPSTEATTVTVASETESLEDRSFDGEAELDPNDRLLNPTGYIRNIMQLRQQVLQNSATRNRNAPSDLAPDISDKEILLIELRNLIANICRSLRGLQNAGFCGGFFSILILDNARPTVAKLLPIEIAKVERLSALFEDTLLHLKEFRGHGQQAATKSDPFAVVPLRNRAEKLTSACRDLLVQLQLMPNISMLPSPAYLWATAVDLLDLAVLSYVGTHTEDLDDTYRDCSGALHIPGRLGILPRTEFEHLAAENIISVQKRKLQCLDQFLGRRSVWVFQNPSTNSTCERLYLSTDVNTLADIWGPLWKIKPDADSHNVSRYDLGNGFIVPWDRRSESDPDPSPNGEGGREVFCHWIYTRDWDDSYVEQHQMEVGNKYFLETDRLLIGASVKDRLTVNAQCNMPLKRRLEIKQELKNNGNLRWRGTRPFHRQKGSQSFQVQASAAGFATLGTTIEYKRVEGFNRKDILLQQWRNRSRNIQHLEIWGGVEVSLCTRNARRVQLLHLLRSRGLQRYLKTICFPWIDVECETAYFEALNDRRSFQKLWMEHPEWRLNIGDAIYECFIVLEGTGVDERDDELSVLWVEQFEDDNGCEENGWGFAFVAAEEHLIILRRSEHNWTGLLKDSPDCLTMAIAEDICLDYDDSDGYGMRCQGLRPRHGKGATRFSSGYPVLQTALHINEDLLEEISQRQLLYRKIAKDANESDCSKRKGKFKRGEADSSDHAAYLMEYFGEVPRIWKGYWNTTNLREGTKFSLGLHGHLEVLPKLTDGYSVLMEWQPVLNKLGKDLKVELKEVALGRSGGCHHWEYMGGACLEAPVPCLILSSTKPSKKKGIGCS